MCGLLLEMSKKALISSIFYKINSPGVWCWKRLTNQNICRIKVTVLHLLPGLNLYVPNNSLLLLADGQARGQNDPAVVGTAIPGLPGEDYPILVSAVETSFLCDGKAMGYYADPEGECQQFHICVSNDIGSQSAPLKFTFLCPNGTLFNQQYFICDWWFNVDCSQVSDIVCCLFVLLSLIKTLQFYINCITKFTNI